MSSRTSTAHTTSALRRGRGVYAIGFSTLAALTVAACGGDNDSPPAAKTLAQSCSAYRAATLPHGASVTTTEMRAAAGSLPSVCIVRGEIVSSPESTINWAVELPDRTLWNGKTLTIGGGGFDGFIPTDDPWYQQLVGASANPYVKISSDSGHQAPGFLPWGHSDVAVRNHAFDANHFALEVGTVIATEFYGRAPTRRYHMGHSNGGRSGLISAQRYPADYDGIVAMVPAISQQAHQTNLGPTVLRNIFQAPENWLSPAKRALYANAETAACDALDGLQDGMIGNVEACNYVPTDLLCTGADSDTCLTAGQIESIRLTYESHSTPITFPNNFTGYQRFGRGGASTSDWRDYLYGSSFEAQDSFNLMAVREAARLVENDLDADPLSHDPTQFEAQYQRLAAMIDGTNPDISAFADNGGKLIIWYALSDACVSVYRAADYFDRVKQTLGATRVQGFARMLTSPSIGHNLDGPGTSPHSIDLLSALDAWVERDTAPDNLVASKFEAGSTTPTLQRPVCEFPMFPRYNGTGDPTRAASFTCAAT